MKSESMSKQMFDLGNGTSIWRVHIDSLREQELNARVMDQGKFRKLVDQIKKDKRLETLPLCAIEEKEPGVPSFAVVSGHHRTRAARAAGLLEIFVLAFNDSLGSDYVKAKQLAHNSIQGSDDPQKLKEIYDQIVDVEAKIQAAVSEIDFNLKFEKGAFNTITLPIDYEMINIVFLPHQRRDFEDVMRLLAVSDGEDILVAEREMFDAFKTQIRRVARAENIRNVSTIIHRMCEIVKAEMTKVEEANAEKAKLEKPEKKDGRVKA